MIEGLNWPTIAAGVSVVIAVGGLVWRLASRIQRAETQIEDHLKSCKEHNRKVDRKFEVLFDTTNRIESKVDGVVGELKRMNGKH